ncbi:hypothetical protein Q7C18_09265 [Nesterenkonia sp. CL21]|uniref:hypothetical protein n=1 Tax=Nesterenkonia sp. CL21 TaxID=3064894 RepID=UPI00287B2C3D|nr:hypothetical protein [Nesterenkonia sp. CL21]MDS2172884.1 hypothetical protein [Nesterenkonia sp. CL21]
MRPNHAQEISGGRLVEAQLLLDEPQLIDSLTGPGPWHGTLPWEGSSTRGGATSRITLERAQDPERAVRLRLVPSRPASAAEVDEQIRSLLGLLAFARLAARPAVTYQARIAADGSESSEAVWVTRDLPGTRREPVAGHTADGDVTDEDPTASGPPMFSTTDVAFADLLTGWQELRTQHETALSLLLAGTGLSEEFPEASMLVLLGAAEAIFVTTSGLRRREIKDSTLRRKLEHLAQQVGVDKVVAPEIPAAVWAEHAARLRSTFTHSGRLDPGTAAELRLLVQLTAGVVVLMLLRELGVPAGEDRRRLRSLPMLREAVPAPRASTSPTDRPPASAPPGLVGGLPASLPGDVQVCASERRAS